MNSFPVPIKIVAAALLSLSLVWIGILNFRDRAAWEEPSDGIFWTESAGSLQVAAVDAHGPASKSGIQLGERLISINQRPIVDLGQYYGLLDELKPGVPLSYTLQTNAGHRTVVLRLETRSLLNGRAYLRTLLAFLYLGIGIFVLIRADRLPRTYHFYLLCLTSFVVYLFSYTTRFGVLDWWVLGI